MAINYSQALPVGRLLRLLFGSLWTLALWVGNPAITVQTFNVLGYLSGVVVLYVLATIVLGRRIISKLNPWLGAVLLDLPVILAFVPLLPPSFRLAILLFFGVSMVCAGVCGYGGCEVLAIPNMLLRKSYNVACIIFSPIDWLEYKLKKLSRRA